MDTKPIAGPAIVTGGGRGLGPGCGPRSPAARAEGGHRADPRDQEAHAAGGGRGRAQGSTASCPRRCRRNALRSAADAGAEPVSAWWSAPVADIPMNRAPIRRRGFSPRGLSRTARNPRHRTRYALSVG